MTKFVAALFLPFVLGVSALLLRPHRALLSARLAPVGRPLAVVLVLTVPWFVYAQSRYGTYYWEAIFGEHVYRRFTSYLDSGHVQPLFYYVTTMYHAVPGIGHDAARRGRPAAVARADDPARVDGRGRRADLVRPAARS